MAIYAHQTAVGVFDDDDLADEAVEGLRNAGFTPARFTILAMLRVRNMALIFGKGSQESLRVISLLLTKILPINSRTWVSLTMRVATMRTSTTLGTRSLQSKPLAARKRHSTLCAIRGLMRPLSDA